MSEIRAYRCDHEGCSVVSLPWEDKVRPKPTARANRQAKNRLHYCAEHYPHVKCSSCNRALRPYDAPASEWPGTLAKQQSDPPLCSTCYQGGFRAVNTKADVPPEVAVRVRRLVVGYYQRFEADAWEEPADDVIALLGLD